MTTTRADLVLADGTAWRVEAKDAHAAEVVSRMIKVMRMDGVRGGTVTPTDDPPLRLLVSVDTDLPTAAASSACNPASGTTAHSIGPFTCDKRKSWPEWATIYDAGENEIHCILKPLEGKYLTVVRLMRLSALIALRAQRSGGLLLHGALAEREGQGVILAGPGGAGKTTASRRFPPPWCSLSDDRSLVMCDGRGNIWAHPWPTWSNFMNGGSGGDWDVQHSVPLRGIFFLSQGKTDQARSIGEGEALCLLLDSVDQTLKLVSRDLGLEERRALHLQRFSNARALVKAVASHRLDMSPDGDFWLEIEGALQRGGG